MGLRNKTASPITIPRQVYLMILVLLIYFIGTGALEFAFGPYLNNFTESFVLISWLIASAYIIAMIVNIPIGNLTDRIGARIIVALSLGALILVGYLYSIALELLTLIPILLFWGALYQGVLVPGEAYIRKKTRGKNAAYAMGFMEAAIASGFALGPLLAGYMVENLEIKTIFYFFSITCAIAFGIAIMIKRVHAKKKSFQLLVEQDKAVFLSAIKRFAFLEHKSHHVALAVLFVGFLVAVWDAIVWFTIPFYLIQRIIEPLWAGILEAIFMGTLIGVLPLSGFIVAKTGRRMAMLSGFLISMVFSYLFVLFIGNPLMMAIYAFFIAWGVGISFPAAESLLTDLGYKRDLGKVSGIYNMAKDLGYVMGTALTGAFVLLWVGAPFIFTGFLFAAAAGISVALIKH